MGLLLLSTATSTHAKPVAVLNEAGESGNSSPKRKKPKNAKEAMAHSTTLSGFEDASREDLILFRIWAVMGRRMRGAEPLSILRETEGV